MKIAYLFIGLLACALGIGISQFMMPGPESELTRVGASTGVADTNSVGANSPVVIPHKIGGDFTLMQGEQPVALSDFSDKLIVMYFGFTSCPDVCPTTLVFIASALKELAPEELAQIQPVFVSVDPERDQGEQLMDYATYFHPDFIGITGTPDEVQKAANQYGAFFIKTDTESAMGYMVEHTSETYLVRDGGEQVTALPHEMTKQSLLDAIRLELKRLKP